jgi:hypothetical protein
MVFESQVGILTFGEYAGNQGKVFDTILATRDRLLVVCYDNGHS